MSALVESLKVAVADSCHNMSLHPLGTWGEISDYITKNVIAAVTPHLPAPPTPKRVCYNCQQPMGNSHKWTLIPIKTIDGKSAQVMAHRFCDNPKGYKPAALKEK
jgi:hypothetical protein